MRLITHSLNINSTVTKGFRFDLVVFGPKSAKIGAAPKKKLIFADLGPKKTRLVLKPTVNRQVK